MTEGVTIRRRDLSDGSEGYAATLDKSKCFGYGPTPEAAEAKAFELLGAVVYSMARCGALEPYLRNTGLLPAEA